MKFIVSITGVFFVLHGLVHLLYVAQSQRLLELQEGMDWPAGSWAFSKPLGDDLTRWLASLTFLIVAVGFAVGGFGLFARQGWWRPLISGSAALSATVLLLLWNGKLRGLSDQGLIALLIDAAILFTALVLHWP